MTTGFGPTAITSGAAGTGPLTVNAGTVDLGAFNLAVGGLGGTGGTIASSSTTTPGALTIVSGATPQTFSGTIADTTGAGSQTVSVVVAGSGVQTFSGPNTYSGGTIVNGGTLTVGSGGTLGATTGTLRVNNPNVGAGTNVVLNLPTGAPITTGSLSGTIATPVSGANTATINTQTGQTFTVNQTALGMYAGTIAGGGGFTLGTLSTNPLILSGANTYTGGTTVNAGTLVMTNPANNFTAGGLTVGAGAAFNYQPTAAGGLNFPVL